MSSRSDPPFTGGAGEPSRGGARRAAVTTAAVAALVVLPLVPGVLGGGGAAALVGLPVESIVAVLLVLTVTGRLSRGLAAAAFGCVVVAALLAGALDAAFRATIDRPFNPADDGRAVLDGYGVVADALGPLGAASAALLALVLVAAAAAGLALAALRTGAVARAHPRGRVVVAGVAVAWIALAVVGAHSAQGAPLAAARSGGELAETTERALASVRELAAFDREVRGDTLAADPGFAALRGKDVVLVFVESYGRVSLEDAPFTSRIRQTLAQGETDLARAGYDGRSAFLTSPTFGGVSWLAHATLQAGVWVDSPQKYARLLDGERATLSGLFGAAGWHTMSVVPSNGRDWDEGRAFYGFDTMLDARTMGYRGPAFGYARMPDQYTWRAFHDRRSEVPGPVMAEIDLVSSHTPWTPLPELVPWSQLGDGRVFASHAAAGPSAAEVWGDPARVRELYGASIAYSLEATFSYLETFGRRDLVVVLVGDHQPAPIVSGTDASHDVPVTIIAQDPAVLDAVEEWGWERGIHPSASAPVWRMDEFRDRFVAAFGG